MFRPYHTNTIQYVLSYTYALARWIIWSIVGLIVIHIFIATIFIVDGPSMDPNLATNDFMLVNKIAYLTSNPNRGDIVVLKFPGDPDKRKFVKRVIGLPGETVEVKNGAIFINSQLLIEAYLDAEIDSGLDQKVFLGEDEYFTCGDNRPNSNDSRFFGPVPKNYLIGRTRFILFPISRFGFKTNVDYNL
ncbi:MAG: Signal peptidase I [Berkelbacteria bacterium GW2011_GWA2_35_9]|uniref:Signal peptidase I n=1 Tax=Berkelbacteria bacterium GW2011_GWA2_35_9 TaxID=1618333 RepID=A0A0G0GAT8_9BACT|nr:MAG: Signal peptidase I [Berkelbacteria bacterium GW2011_GWA2_35_9]